MTKFSLSVQSTDFHPRNLHTARFLCPLGHQCMCKYPDRLKTGSLDAHVPNVSIHGHGQWSILALNTENEAFWVLNVSVVHLLGGSSLAQDKEPSNKSPYFILSPSF